VGNTCCHLQTCSVLLWGGRGECKSRAASHRGAGTHTQVGCELGMYLSHVPCLLLVTCWVGELDARAGWRITEEMQRNSTHTQVGKLQDRQDLSCVCYMQRFFVSLWWEGCSSAGALVRSARVASATDCSICVAVLPLQLISSTLSYSLVTGWQGM
jgi:hypothetical protein